MTGVVQLKTWMRPINDDTSIGKLSIAGTHNSAASHVSFPSVRCQGASITTQLHHGVRFIDIRCARPYLTVCSGIFGSDNDDLQVIHGVFPVKIPTPMKLRDVLDELYAFLQENPSETVIVSLKPEGPSTWEGDDFANLLWETYLNNAQERWYLRNKIPKIGEVRGKLILFRRFGCSNEELRNRAHDFGIDAAWWQYNSADDDHEEFAVQDWCEITAPEDITKKYQFIQQHMSKAIEFNKTTTDKRKLFINFCSGSNFWNPMCWPKSIAKSINMGIQSDIGLGCGIIIIDYAEYDDWKTVSGLVDLNKEFFY